MQILWMSDSPTSASGVGNVTRFVCAGLAAYGHHVDILGWQTRGLPVVWQNCALFPFHRRFGADLLRDYLRGLRPDVLVTLHDISLLTDVADPVITGVMRTAAIPWVMYYPTGSWLWQRLTTSPTPQALTEQLQARFPSLTGEQAVSDVSTFLEELVQHGMVRVEE